MKDLLRRFTESVWRICVGVGYGVSVIALVLLMYGACQSPIPPIETDLRPRVRGPRPVPLQIVYDLSLDGTNWVRQTNWFPAPKGPVALYVTNATMNMEKK